MRWLPFLLLMLAFTAQGQLFDDFSDGDLTQNPSWQGNTDHFIVNASGQLQLNAPDAGTSDLFSTLSLEDSIEWNLFFEMKFSPSTSNKLSIYLALDQMDVTSANGYYLQIGENGSDDAINFYILIGGTPTLLGSATMSAVGSDPALARLQIKKTAIGEWSLKADYDGGNLLLDDLMLVNNDIDISGNQFFGFNCAYTATRADKFYFDDIDIKKAEQDISGPILIDATVLNPSTILLSYDEIVQDISDLEELIVVDQGIGVAADANVVINTPNQIEVTLANNLASGLLYEICSEGIQDLAGNASTAACQNIFLNVEPEIGDLFVNEILFNPNTGGKDFVEIINTSDKFISLDNVYIENAQNGQSDQIEAGVVMLPQEIIAFTDDPNVQVEMYEPTAPDQILRNGIPAFNVDEGNVSLILKNGLGEITLDSFNYQDNFHFNLLDNVKGVSLEKIVSNSETNNSGGWHSAAEQANFATPGYENSSSIPIVTSGSDLVQIPHKTFSPNGDGDKDLFAIQFNLDTPGYLANVKVFNDRGVFIRNLANNVLLSTNSFVYWNGISNEGVLSDIGIYVVLIELFDLDGNVQKFKETLVLADFLD